MDYRLFFPATKRNCNPIGDALSQFLPQKGTVLEVASGSGEHAVAFQKRFSHLIWQASDPELSHRKSIDSWIEHERLNFKMPKALDLDVEEIPWKLPSQISSSINTIVCINLIHICSWGCTKSLFYGSSFCLEKDCHIIIYGPFKANGYHTSKSNENFHKSLINRNIDWGLRNIEDVNSIAILNGFSMIELREMPSNNMLLVLVKK